MKTVQLFLFFVLAFGAAGCAATITPMGRDSYMIESMKSVATMIRLANEECTEQGKVLVVRRYDAPRQVLWQNDQPGNVIFSCVLESDPEYRRPNMQSDPTVRIENR